tara:strand:- start:69 stop:524 length:456 start_codon:yes stop_codon:yes gene_type:complete
MAKDLICIPLKLKEANVFVKEHHRHSTQCRGHRFSLGAIFKDELVGVAIIGRAINRYLDNRFTAEVLRNCVLETAPKGTCSFLYSRAMKVWQSQGGKKIITYTLETEPGSSLKAVSFDATATTGLFKGGWQNRSNRQEYKPIRKVRWEKIL